MSEESKTDAELPAAEPQPEPQRKVRTPGRNIVPPAGTPAPAAALPEDTPNAIDVDPKTIDGPVLTRQGWVCPDMRGREQRGYR